MKSKYEDEFNQFCKQVINLDPVIRFAGIANEDGVLESIAERENLIPLLSPEDRARYAITAATRQYTRLRWEFMLGKIQYASSKYEKLIRATIPITDENSTLSYVLLLSFDPDVSNFHEIITKKIIPFINESKANLKRLHG